MLYKGYIKTKGKKAIEAFKDRTKYRTYDEVKNLEGFGGVLADDTILIDIDDAEQSEILMIAGCIVQAGADIFYLRIIVLQGTGHTYRLQLV